MTDEVQPWTGAMSHHPAASDPGYLTDEQVVAGMRAHFKQYGVEITVSDVVRTGPWTYSLRIEDTKDVSEEPAEMYSIQLCWEIGGIAKVELEPTMTANRFNVQSLWVDPEYQNLGIGTALMNIVHHEADQFGIELWLVPQPMEGHILDLERFYTRLGYEPFGMSGYWIRKSPTTEPE